MTVEHASEAFGRWVFVAAGAALLSVFVGLGSAAVYAGWQSALVPATCLVSR